MAKDYYSILGVPRDADKDTIKKKYKELSKTWHPDLCRDKSKLEEYEEKFKEINEAYSVLSDEKKRAEYDNPQGSFDGFDFNDFSFFRNGFGFNGFNRRARQVNKGSDLRIKINVTLEDIFNGGKKTFKYKRLKPCPTCQGKGHSENGKVTTCFKCNGSGKIYTEDHGWQKIETCPHCHGLGQIIENPCPTCNGDGVTMQEETIEFAIPKGIHDGQYCTINGYGNAPIRMNGIFGDFIVIIQVAEHDKFFRNGNDLYFELPINVVDALLGSQAEVETIDKKKLSVKLNSGLSDGVKIKLKGKGMTIMDSSSFGDMYGVIKLIIPTNLNDKEKELLAELKKQEHFG